MAEREGFEPPGLVSLPLSRRVHLSALPPFPRRGYRSPPIPPGLGEVLVHLVEQRARHGAQADLRRASGGRIGARRGGGGRPLGATSVERRWRRREADRHRLETFELLGGGDVRVGPL